MARPAIKGIFNLDSREDKLRLQRFIGVASGYYEVRAAPKLPRRTLLQNNYYFGVCIAMLSDYLKEQDPEANEEAAHEWAKAKFLLKPIICQETGELLGRYVRSTASLSRTEFFDYVERLRAWMLDFLNISTPDPDPDYWRQTEKMSADSTPA